MVKVANKIYKLISRLYIKIMAVVIAKKDFFKEYPDDNPSKWAFELLVERINRYVTKKSTNQYGISDECGLLVMDFWNIFKVSSS